MKIKKLHATFGCLRDDTLELRDGLNVIHAPNEGGKSTWCAFLSAMLYGIDSSQREKYGMKPDKIKYQPWSGEAMQGEMELEKDGVNLTVMRRTRLASAPMRELSVTYTGTARSIPALENSDLGEYLTGMTRQVFASSAFVKQNAMAVSHSPELEKRIASIASTGEETVSYTEAENRLRSWQRKRMYNRRGAIPELDRRIEELQKRLENANETVQEQLRLKAELENTRKRRWDEMLRMEQSMEKSREQLVADLARARRNVEQCRMDEQRTERELSRCREEMSKSPFGNASIFQAKNWVVRDIRHYKSYQDISTAPLNILIVLGVLAAAAGIALMRFPMAARIALADLGVALVVVWAVGTIIMGRKRRENAHRRHSILRHYGVDDISQLSDLLASHKKLCEKCQKAEELLETQKQYTYYAERILAEAENAAVTGSAEVALPGEDREAELCANRIAMLEGRMSALGDPVVTQSQLQEAREKRKTLMEQYDAIGLASQVLAAANDELQQRFSPALGHRTAEYMSHLTDGRYDRVSLDRDMSARVRHFGDVGDREMAYLSAGTMDQLYFAMRLALCDLALDSECPLILDDAMVNFDDERMERAMDLLDEISKKRQVILFTCHTREQNYLKQKALI